MKRKRIYLDFAAATPIARPVLRAMRPYLTDAFGNPSSLHEFGRSAKEAVEVSRKTIARYLSCSPDEIFFTGSGTESVNLALKGYIETRKAKRQHIVTTAVEHPATREVLAHLKHKGHTVSYVPPASNGIIRSTDVIAAIRQETTLITAIFIQNEIGTIQPIADIGKKLLNHNRTRLQEGLLPVLFHVDACQAPAFMEVTMPRLHADMLSLDATKTYGPKGVGLLFIRRGITLVPQIHGGGQENNVRSGTENVAAIVGFAAAIEYVSKHRDRQTKRISSLRDNAIQKLLKSISNCRLTGDPQLRIANNIHITLKGIDGEALLFNLDRRDIMVSTGSACSSAKENDSHVLVALQIPRTYRNGSLRLTLGYQTTKRDVDTAIIALKKIVHRLRLVSKR